MANVNIEAMEAKGFKRWTKGNFDRMYINANALGLECDFYKSGNISYAEWKGEKISNSYASRLSAAKTYFDLKDGKLHGTNEMLLDAAAELLDSIE